MFVKSYGNMAITFCVKMGCCNKGLDVNIKNPSLEFSHICMIAGGSLLQSLRYIGYVSEVLKLQVCRDRLVKFEKMLC